MTEIGNPKLIFEIRTPENPLAEIKKEIESLASDNIHLHILKAL